MIVDSSGLVGGGVSVSSLAKGGSRIAFDGLRIIYTPPKDYSGRDYFTYRIKDAGPVFTGSILDPLEVEGTITIDIEDVNDPPITTPKTRTISERQTLTLTPAELIAGDLAGPANETSPPPLGQGQTVTFSAVSNRSTKGGTVELLNIGGQDRVVYTPPAFFNSVLQGPDTFQYFVTDSQAVNGTSSGIVTVFVNQVNDPPFVVKSFGTVEIDEDATTREFILSEFFGDPDIVFNNDSLSYVVFSNTNQSLVEPEIAGGKLSVKPKLNQNGTATIVVEATDLEGAKIRNTLTLIVNAVNDGPEVKKPLGSLTLFEDPVAPEEWLLSDYFSDPDGDVLSYQITSNSNTSLIEPQIVLGKLVLQPKLNQNGTATIVVQARDTAGRTVTSTLSLTVTPVNDDPFVVKPFGTVTIPENTSQEFTLSEYFSDPDIATNSDVLSYRVVSNSNTALVNPTLAAGKMTVRPNRDKFGTATIVVEAKDRDNKTATNTLVLNVTQAQSRYQNPVNRYDVNADGFVSPIDVLIVINFLNTQGSRPTDGLPGPPDYVDVNGNRFVDPLDVLEVINMINNGGRTPGGEGEGSGAGEGRVNNPLGWSMDLGSDLLKAPVGPLENNPSSQEAGRLQKNRSSYAAVGTPRVTGTSCEAADPVYFGLPAEDDDLDDLASDIVFNGTQGSQDLVDQVFADLFGE
jgi:hypothetical protein